MTLAAGTRLGPYEILAAVGAGGMGEVYRATDANLGREVAIKVLPDAFAQDAERLARFEREAKTLAALNHPYIAQIYGLEKSSGVQALVMELVEGEDLAQRIARGPIPIDEALPIAKQIAQALEAAHEQGIVHRDLKPANIKIRSDGTVKVLDFGLAKLTESAGSRQQAGSPLSMSPTLTSPPLMTGVGTLLGTAAYMAPEQVRGRAADQRSDIWAFGCVVYEMLAGTPPFQGEDAAEMLGAVMKSEPDWTKLPRHVPEAIRVMLSVCLRKDVTKRFRHAGDLALACDAAQLPAIVTSPMPQPRTRLITHPFVVGAAGILIGLTIGSLAVWSLAETPQPSGHFRAMLAPGQRMAGLDLTAIEFAPDRQQFAYVATTGGPQQLYLGRLDSFDSKPIPGTDGAASPFFSPDGQWLGFFTSDGLKKVALTGGPPVSLSRADNFGRGGAWTRNGVIIFAPRFDDGLFVMPDTGGTPRQLTRINREKGDLSHRFPHLLPGENELLFTVGTGGSWDDARIEAVTLATGARKVLIQGGSDARYVPTGHIVYTRAGMVMAVPFDLRRLEVTGAPVALLDGVLPSTNNTGSAQIAFSQAGAAIYVAGSAGSSDRTLVLVDRSGVEQPLQIPRRSFRHPRLSRDGQRLVFDIDEGNKADVWAYDVPRGTLTKLTFSGETQFPVWNANSTRVIYQSYGNMRNLVAKNADGTGNEEPLTMSDHPQRPGSWSDDDRVFVFGDVDPRTGSDIWALSMDGGSRARPFLQTPFNEYNPAISPDSRWLAYQSDESGRNEIYIQPFPGPGAKTVASTDGGTEPAWSGDGKELFYRNGDRMMVISLVAGPALQPSRPLLLFTKPAWVLPGTRNYDVSRDGRRFLMITESEQVSSATHVNVLLNWFEDVKRLVATK